MSSAGAAAEAAAAAAPVGAPGGGDGRRASSRDRIAFGSCHSQHYRNPSIWDAVASRNPFAFIWVGDAVYADDFVYAKSDKFPYATKAIPFCGEPKEMADLYRNLTSQEEFGYRKLIAPPPSSFSATAPPTILGAWDDHDYGCNNGDSTYRYKVESAIEYVKFLRASNQNAGSSSSDLLDLMSERAKSGKGVYGAKVFDFSNHTGGGGGKPGRRHQGPGVVLSDLDAGIEPSTPARDEPLPDRTVAVFLLDIRTHKTPWPKGKGWRDRFLPDYTGDFLGEEQWQWLEAALRRSTATVNVVVQGLQVHADRFWDGNLVEDWSRFPISQHRLYQTVLKLNVSAPILVSGDVHMAEMLRKDCRQRKQRTDGNGIGSFSGGAEARMLLEVTMSGMTHTWGTNICARPNSSGGCRSRVAARSLAAGMHLAHWNGAWTDVVDLRHHPGTSTNNGVEDGGSGGKQRYQYTLQRNFGEFEFDWVRRQVAIRVFGEAKGSGPILNTRWDFDALSGRQELQNPMVRTEDYDLLYRRIAPHLAPAGGGGEDDWICVNYRGHPGFWLKLFGFISPITTAGLLMSLPVSIPLAVLILLALYFIARNRQSSKLQQAEREINERKKCQ